MSATTSPTRIASAQLGVGRCRHPAGDPVHEPERHHPDDDPGDPPNHRERRPSGGVGHPARPFDGSLCAPASARGVIRVMARSVRRYCATVSMAGVSWRGRVAHRGPHQLEVTLPRAHGRAERDRALGATGRATWPLQRYQISDKFEYFAVRNSAGIFDSSPLFKYRIHGRDAEAFPRRRPGSRHPDSAPPGNAQYTVWLGRARLRRRGRGHPSPRPWDEFLLTSAEPNFAYFGDLIGRGKDVYDRGSGAPISVTLAIQGPRSRDLVYEAQSPTSATTSLTSDSRLRRLPAPRHWCRGPAIAATSAMSCGSPPRTPLKVWDTVWDASRLRRPPVRPDRPLHAPHRGGPGPARCRLPLEPVRLDLWDRTTPIGPASAGCSARLAYDDRAFIGRTRPAVNSPTRPPAGT